MTCIPPTPQNDGHGDVEGAGVGFGIRDLGFGTPGVVKSKSKFEMNGKQTGNGERTVGGFLRRLRLVNGGCFFFFPSFFLSFLF